MTGYGLEGRANGRNVRLWQSEVDRWRRVASLGSAVRRRAAFDGSLTVFVAIDDQPAGAFLLEDPIRPDAPE